MSAASGGNPDSNSPACGRSDGAAPFMRGNSPVVFRDLSPRRISAHKAAAERLLRKETLLARQQSEAGKATLLFGGAISVRLPAGWSDARGAKGQPPVKIYAYYRDHAGSDRAPTHALSCLGKRPQGPDMLWDNRAL